MRTVTLGALIVSVGTLAALPFRRYHAIPDASSGPAQVTGPIQSALDAPTDSAPTANVAAEQIEPTWRPDNLLSDLPPRQPRRAVPPRRSMDIPLTYNDLSMPVDMPQPVRQRFTATAEVRQHQLQREQLAGLVMPKMESLAASQQEQLRHAQEQNADQRSRGATASLASSQPIQRLPEVKSEERHRHWIQQP